MVRKYEYQLSTLIDLLSIVTLKSIKLSTKKYQGDKTKKEEYEKEARLIMEDINTIIQEKGNLIKDWGIFIRAIQVGAIANEVIWENETKARLGSREQDHLLPFTHAVNTIRMRCGNVIANQIGERKDLNIDKMNDEISEERGYNWGNLFDNIYKLN